MLEMDSMYTGYGFASHKGYPTPEHCRALKELGAVPIHRRSFARVREVLGLDPIQNELFTEANEADSREVETVAATATSGPHHLTVEESL